MRRLGLLLAFAVIATAGTDDHGRGRGHEGDEDERHGEKRQDREDRDGDRRGGVVFRPQDRQMIYDYYRVAPANLPPGLQKKLARTGRLPPGWEKRIAPFPMDLERRLPPVPAGYTRGIYGNQAVIYDPRTQAILDVVNIVIGAARR